MYTFFLLELYKLLVRVKYCTRFYFEQKVIYRFLRVPRRGNICKENRRLATLKTLRENPFPIQTWTWPYFVIRCPIGFRINFVSSHYFIICVCLHYIIISFGEIWCFTNLCLTVQQICYNILSWIFLYGKAHAKIKSNLEDNFVILNHCGKLYGRTKKH